PLRCKPSGFRALADELQHVPVVPDPLVADFVATALAEVVVTRIALVPDDPADLGGVPIHFRDLLLAQEPIRIPGVDLPSHLQGVEFARGNTHALPSQHRAVDAHAVDAS